MAAPLPNVWHLRSVAEAQSKACYICYKPTTKVLITPDNKDFFYICASHLTDRGFASPMVDKEAEEAKQKKEAMDREIEKVKQEYEEKQRKKKAKKKAKDDSKDKDKKEKEKADDDVDGEAEKERDEKIKSIKGGGASEPKMEDGPRIFILHKNFYQMRVDKIRNAEMAKRSQQRINNPSFFPSAPKNDLT